MFCFRDSSSIGDVKKKKFNVKLSRISLEKKTT